MHFIGYHQMLYHTQNTCIDFFLSRFLKVKLDEKKMSNSLLISLYHINKIGQKMFFFFLNSISILALVPCPLFCQLEPYWVSQNSVRNFRHGSGGYFNTYRYGSQLLIKG